jgi:hypothetical protein
MICSAAITLRLRSVARPIGHAGLRILALEHRVLEPALKEVLNVAATADFCWVNSTGAYTTRSAPPQKRLSG